MKLKKIAALILALITVLACFASCMGADVDPIGTAKIVIETDMTGDEKYIVYELELSSLESREDGALSLLKYLQKEKGLQADIADSTYGAYVNSIASLIPDSSKGEYVSVYTSEEADFAVPTEWAPTVSFVKYGDVMLKFSGVGLSSMSVKDGTIILFRLESYTA